MLAYTIVTYFYHWAILSLLQRHQPSNHFKLCALMVFIIGSMIYVIIFCLFFLKVMGVMGS